MKRLYRIGGSIFFLSIFSVLTWIVLGITLSPEISNVFSVTYPVQFISLLLLSFFGKASYIRSKREDNKNAVLSGMVLGIGIDLIITIILLIFVDGYIAFFGLDKNVYRTFTIYAIILEFVKYVFSMILEKMYFEEKDKQASAFSLIFNILSFASVVITSLVTKNQLTIIIVGLVPIGLFVLYLFFKQLAKFRLDFNIVSNFKYESSNVLCFTVMFATYFFGYGNAFKFGNEYVVALNFVNLISDAQWDSFEAVSTAAKIDITSGTYNHKKSVINSSLFSSSVILITICAYFGFYKIFNVDYKIGLIFLLVQAIDMMLSPLYYGFDTFIQLEYSPTQNTANHLIGYIVRFAIGTFVQNGYCVILAQIISSALMCIHSLTIRFGKYNLEKDGTLSRKTNQKNENLTA